MTFLLILQFDAVSESGIDIETVSPQTASMSWCPESHYGQWGMEGKPSTIIFLSPVGSLGWADNRGSQDSALQVHLWWFFYEKEYRWVLLRSLSLGWFRNNLALNMHLILLTASFNLLAKPKWVPWGEENNMAMEKENPVWTQIGYSWIKIKEKRVFWIPQSQVWHETNFYSFIWI